MIGHRMIARVLYGYPSVHGTVFLYRNPTVRFGAVFRVRNRTVQFGDVFIYN